MGVSDVMSAILQRADTFLVATFAGFDALAIYTAAEFITRVIANPRYLFDYIIAPVVAEALHMEDRARIRYNLALVTRWVTTVVRADRRDGDRAARRDPASLRRRLRQRDRRADHPRGPNLIVACLGLTPYVLVDGRAVAPDPDQQRCARRP